MKTIPFIILGLFAVLQSYSQDYLISFSGTGASSTFDLVRVDNLSQNKSVTVHAGYMLRLKSVISGISTQGFKNENTLRIYPNPAGEICQAELEVSEPGDAVLGVFDLSGKLVARINSFLSPGKNVFTITGLNKGVYYVKGFSDKLNLVGKIISQGEGIGNVQIQYDGKSDEISGNKIPDKKSSDPEVLMQFNTGDLLMFTAKSGEYSTVFMDVPSESKPVIFNFVESSDGDNTSYPTITIETQTWMATNLRTTSYNDGTLMTEVTENADWADMVTPAYCWYANDSASYAKTYGALYNWHAVNTGKLCPAGWHVPISYEFSILTDYLGGEDIAGGNLKESGTNHWKQPNTAATNASGFTALPGGTRNSYGEFNTLGLVGSFWSATEAPPTGAYSRPLFCDTPDAYLGWAFAREGFSVRCILGDALSGLPVIVTNDVSDISGTSANGGGSISYDGGSAIIACGLCWSLNPAPTISDNKSDDIIHEGVFSTIVGGLTPNTTYFLRAYATNEDGTGYGNEISFTTTTEIKNIVFNPELTYGNISDIENNTYKTIVIGTQEWMAENLKVTMYNNGDLIGTTDPPTLDIMAEYNPKYQWAYNGNESYADIYGRMYTWYAVNDSRNICPAGWHVPSDLDWTVLTDYLGGLAVAGGKLKETGTSHWNSPNTGASNVSGFTALPGGYRYDDGSFVIINYTGLWWSSTENSTVGAWGIGLGSGKENASVAKTFGKTFGYSVRCLKGDAIPGLPVISTSIVSAITDTSAIVGIHAIDEGGSPILETGVYWGTQPHPEVTGAKLEIAHGIGEFSFPLTGLAPSTRYYVVSYAWNNSGESTANEVEFITTSGIHQGSFLKINDNEYILTDGINAYSGDFEGKGIYNHGIILLSPGHIVNWETLETSGSGAVVDFEIFNTKPVIENQTYPFSLPEDMNTIKECPGIDINADGLINENDCIYTMPDGAFYISSRISAYDDSTNLNVFDGFDFATGNVTINIVGEIYTIEFDCIGENGDVVSGFYTGSLHYLDFSEKKGIPEVKILLQNALSDLIRQVRKGCL